MITRTTIDISSSFRTSLQRRCPRRCFYDDGKRRPSVGLMAASAIIVVLNVLQIQAFSSLHTGGIPITRSNNNNNSNHWMLYATTAAGPSTTNTAAEAATTTTLDWSFLDGVYLIHCPNGDPSGERLLSTETILESANLLDATTLKEFETDDENRIRGCYTSHLSVYRDILRSGDGGGGKPSFNNGSSIRIMNTWFDFQSAFPKRGIFSNRNGSSDNNNSDQKCFLILEDNLAVNGGSVAAAISQDAIDSIATFVASNDDWDVMHLAYIPYVPGLQISGTDTKDIVKLSTSGTGSALGTTAYIINTNAMRKLVQEDDRFGFQLPIPDVMAKLFGESRYASHPTLFVRAPSTKSLVNPQLDDLREILFQPLVVAFAQRLLVWTGLTTNALLPLIVAALLTTSIASLQTTVHSLYQYWNTGSLDDGPWILPFVSVPVSLFSLALIVQGALLAPKPDEKETCVKLQS